MKYLLPFLAITILFWQITDTVWCKAEPNVWSFCKDGEDWSMVENINGTIRITSRIDGEYSVSNIFE